MLKTRLGKLHDVCCFMIIHIFLKKKLYAPFSWMVFNCLKASKPIWGESLPFANKFPEIHGTYLTNLRRMKGLVSIEATQWFWTRGPPDFSLCISLVIIKYKLNTQYVKLTQLWPLAKSCIKVSSHSYLAGLS